VDFTHLIVGGGAAGCVLAARLSEDPALRVCLIEAGPSRGGALVSCPAGLAVTVPSRLYNWAFQTEPQAGLNGRRGYQPRGKVLGGSSAINAMVYIRGHPQDYDDWAALGNPGWGWDDVLPVFRATENNERLADAFHGRGGPLNVADLRTDNAFTPHFIQAAQQAGWSHNPDFNGARQEGVGNYQVMQRGGERCSVARAYLEPVLGRANLHLISEAQVLGVLLEGRRAVGVSYRQGGRTHALRTQGEVLLCAGALQTPQLLPLSGIGPAAELQRHGIPVAHALPGVGRNLQDHVDYVLAYRSPSPGLVGISPRCLVPAVQAFRRYRQERRGLLTSNYAEAGGFIHSTPSPRAEPDRPDLQLHLVISLLEDHARKRTLGMGFSCHVCLLRPRSRGSVTLHSTDPLAPPRIDPRFLEDPQDMSTLVRGFRVTRTLLEMPALDPWRGAPMHHGALQTDAQIEDSIRQRADTIYHPVGTCRMGPAADPDAVVDAQLRVHGIAGLRVVDASIMPTLVGGNTTAPVVMIAEKAARYLLRK